MKLRFVENSVKPSISTLEQVSGFARKVASMPENTKYFKTIKPVKADEIIANCKEASAKLSVYKHIFLIGMGGAVNNPKSVLRALKDEKFIFLNTTDPDYISHILNKVNLVECAVLLISNSGQTTENTSIFAALINHDLTIAERTVFLVGIGNNILTNIAKQYKILQINHDQNIGGRFSGFSEVVALPLMAAGYNAKEFLLGASNVAQAFADLDKTLLENLASSVTADKANAVLLSYSNRLSDYNEWYSQVFGESLGKDGQGVYPVVGIGPSGPALYATVIFGWSDSSFYTVIEVGSNNNISTANFDKNNSLSNRFIKDIQHVLCNATVQTLIAQQKPTRHILIEKLNELTMGELMMFTALEVVVRADAMGVNPFDQPAVELIKIRTKAMLANNNG